MHITLVSITLLMGEAMQIHLLPSKMLLILRCKEICVSSLHQKCLTWTNLSLGKMGTSVTVVTLLQNIEAKHLQLISMPSNCFVMLTFFSVSAPKF